MRTALLIVFVVMIGANVTMAQVPGSIAVFDDAAGSSCELTAPTGILTIHVVHLWTDGATASQFKVELAACMVGLGQTPAFTLTTGNFWVNSSVSYGQCLSGPIYLGSLLVQDAACGDCTYVSVEANTDVPPFTRGMTDCATPVPQLHETEGGKAIYKAVAGTCECNVPAEDTSWGQIKSLFE